MKEVRIVPAKGTGALLLDKCSITGREVVGIILADKSEVLALQKNLNEFVARNYPEKSDFY